MLPLLGGLNLKKLVNYIFILAIIINSVSLIWFILGASGFFMRGFDLIMTVLFMYLGIPSIILLIVSVILLYKYKKDSMIVITTKFLLLVIFMVLAYNLYISVDKYGWLEPRIFSEEIKQTEDKKYEYKIELVNMFQKNSYARLYMRGMETNDIKYISLDINTRDIGGFSMDEIIIWGNLVPTEVNDIYLLYTTESFPFAKNQYLIDVNMKKSEKYKE